jgi:hypothetical protein
MEKNKNFTTKRFFSVIGIIFIGALGSGLWDIFLKDLVYNAGNLFVEISSHFYSGYIDSLYENVGKRGSVLQYISSIFIITFIIFVPVFYLIIFLRIYKRLKRSEVSEDDNKKIDFTTKLVISLMKSKKRIYVFILAITLPISLVYTNILIKEITNISANNYIERTLEIIRPNIEESQYILMRSEFRQIDNKEKFESLYFKIKGIALQENIKLPKSKFYGIFEKE